MAASWRGGGSGEINGVSSKQKQRRRIEAIKQHNNGSDVKRHGRHGRHKHAA